MTLKCETQTERLNCGCCEDVVFVCSRPRGHSGPHTDRENTYYSGRYDRETSRYLDFPLTVSWPQEGIPRPVVTDDGS